MFGKAKIGVCCYGDLDLKQTSRMICRDYAMKVIDLKKPNIELSDRKICVVLVCKVKKEMYKKFLFDTKRTEVQSKKFKKLVL